MYINQQIGKLGEDLACKYLKENKYTIIERNFNCKLMKLFMLKELDKILVSSKEKNYAGNLERD